jgi:hypothetical protein
LQDATNQVETLANPGIDFDPGQEVLKVLKQISNEELLNPKDITKAK